MDMSSIASGVSAAKTTIDLIKSSIEISKSLDKADLTSKLIDAQIGALDLLGKQYALVDENRGLKSKIDELEKKLKEHDAVEVHYHLYWMRIPNGSIDGPFDTIEYDRKKALVRLRAINQGVFKESGEEEVVFEHLEDRRKSFLVPLSFLIENGFNSSNLFKTT